MVRFAGAKASPEELILPEKIGSMQDSYMGYSDVDTHIIYKGTKAQWEEIPFAKEWCKNSAITVTCSDGEYKS